MISNGAVGWQVNIDSITIERLGTTFTIPVDLLRNAIALFDGSYSFTVGCKGKIDMVQSARGIANRLLFDRPAYEREVLARAILSSKTRALVKDFGPKAHKQRTNNPTGTLRSGFAAPVAPVSISSSNQVRTRSCKPRRPDSKGQLQFDL